MVAYTFLNSNIVACPLFEDVGIENLSATLYCYAPSQVWFFLYLALGYYFKDLQLQTGLMLARLVWFLFFPALGTMPFLLMPFHTVVPSFLLVF